MREWKSMAGCVARCFGKSARWLCLASALTGMGASARSPAQAPVSSPPASPAAATDTNEGFFSRLMSFYRQDWAGTAPASASPPRRGLPQPLDSPPFPSADWSYGGSPTIGEADTNTYPLQTAINHASSRTKIYGWIEPTVNGSTSSSRNYPETNDIYSNRVELGQVAVYVERLPDEVQQSHIDFGYHLTAFFGTDYRSTTNKGYLSSQLLDHDRQYGFDPVLEYIDIYFPHVAQGMNVRVGRFISIPGIEAQLTPNNYMFSHSLLYAVDPFTDTGALATIQISKQLTVQAGISASHDVAPWTADAKPTFMGCIDYTTSSVNDNVYLCANGINDGIYAFNNLQQYDVTWYHRFSKTWHMATESYIMYERDVPSVHGMIVPELGTNGANCSIGLQTCLAPEYAAVNYINHQLSTHAYISFRSDFLNDKKGQRTGYAGRYSEGTISYNHWFGDTVQLRPEIRFDHAWDRLSYDSGRRRNQFTAATDLVFHF
jgi:hypothetical protein